MSGNLAEATAAFKAGRLPAGENAKVYRLADRLVRGGISTAGMSADAEPDIFPTMPQHELKPRLIANGTLIQGFLDAGLPALIMGAPNVGKSFFALHMGFCVATGRDFFGARVRKQGYVLYVILEGKDGFDNRVAAWRQYYGIDQDERIPLEVMKVRIDLRRPEQDARRIARTVLRRAEKLGVEPALVVIDTLARSMPGADENDIADMSRFVDSVSIIADAGPAVVALHHPTKAEAREGATPTPRGHGVVEGAIDTIISLLHNDKKDAVAVIPYKQRDMDKTGVSQFRLEPSTLGNDIETGDAVTSRVVVELGEAAKVEDIAPKLSDKQRKALSILFAETRKGGAEPVLGNLMTALGIHSVQVGQWREACMDEKLSDAESRTNRTAAFRGWKDALADKGLIEEQGGRVWPTIWATLSGAGDAAEGRG